MLKKVLALTLACLLIVTCLAACSGGADTSGSGASTGGSAVTDGNLDPQNPVTVTLWHYYVGENQQALEAAVSSFNQSAGIEQGVIVEAVAMGSIAELETAITDSAMGIINSQPMPQIFSSYPDKAMEIYELDMVADPGAYFTDEEKNQYVDDFLADGIFEGDRMLMVPIVKSTELLYVNATAWNEFAAAGGYDEEDLAGWESVLDTARAYYLWTDAQTPDTHETAKAYSDLTRWPISSSSVTSSWVWTSSMPMPGRTARPYWTRPPCAGCSTSTTRAWSSDISAPTGSSVRTISRQAAL